MRLGLTLAPDTPSAFDKTIELAVAAERAGFETIYLPEHHFDQRAGFAQPYTVAAAIGAHLERAWLGVHPLLGLEHPLRLVEQSNLLDVFMQGRSLLVLGDDTDPAQYTAFGLPAPRNGLFEHLVAQVDQAWSWQFAEDGPPLELEGGPFASQMAGRVMPAACRQPHPLVARETSDETAVVDAARRGWPVQLRGANALGLIDVYQEALNEVGHPRSVVEECLRWLVVVVDALDVNTRELQQSGAAEIRMEPTPAVSVEQLIASTVRSA